MKRIKLIGCVFLAGLLFGCGQSLSHYRNTSPSFELRQFFVGDLIAWGIVQDYQSQVTRRFCVELEGTWQGREGKLDEIFYFDDGEVTTRTWQLAMQDDGKVEGRAADVIGVAKGSSEGSAFNLLYTLSLPIDGTDVHFTADDWMYKLDDNRVFNRTTLSKVGITLAQITLFIEKVDQKQACRPV